MHYECHKINPNRGVSYIDFLDWIKAKKHTINKKDKKCFQYTVTVALNHEVIKNDPQRITKIKPFQIDITVKEYIFHQKNMIRRNLRKKM